MDSTFVRNFFPSRARTKKSVAGAGAFQERRVTRVAIVFLAFHRSIPKVSGDSAVTGAGNLATFLAPFRGFASSIVLARPNLLE